MRLQSLGYSQYIAAGVSPALARFASASSHPIPDFDIFVAPVDWDYCVPEDATAIFPLWSSNADGYLRWIRHGRTEYVFVSHESSDWRVLAHSEQGILADLYRRRSESLQWDDRPEDQKKCDEFAAYIGFARQQEADHLLTNSPDAFRSWAKDLG
jgi:hypothetical protein